MPPHFALEGGRWRAADGRWFGVSVIDLFEGRRNVMRAFGADAFAVDSGPPPHIFLFEDLIDANWLPEGSAAIGVGDAYVVRKHSACREALDGVPALIEAGLITGGFATVRDVPAVQVTLRPSWATLVVAGGQASDLAGQRELLAIARTIRARWR